MFDLADGRFERVRGHYHTGEHRADEGTDAPEDERDEALCRPAHPLGRFVVHVQLTGDEQEIVANAVDQNRGKDHHRLRLDIGTDTSGKQEIAQHPRQNTDGNRPLVPEAQEHDRQQEQENDVRYLCERHTGGSLRPV